MFKRLRGFRAMEEIFQVFQAQLGYYATPQLVNANPAPALVFASDRHHEIVLTVKDDQFVLWLDDNTPGSIPLQQILGSLTADKTPIPARTIETIVWMAKQKASSGDIRRAIAYLGDVAHLARAAKNEDLHRWAVAERFALWTQEAPAHPTELTSLANDTHRLGMTYENAYVYFLMGKAAELRHEQGDIAFPLESAVRHYETSIEKIGDLRSPEARTLAANARTALARLS